MEFQTLLNEARQSEQQAKQSEHQAKQNEQLALQSEQKTWQSLKLLINSLMQSGKKIAEIALILNKSEKEVEDILK